MYKIVFQKTIVNDKTLLDVFFIKNDIKKSVFYSLNIPKDKITYVNSLIELCQVNSLDKKTYSFVKKEISNLVNDINIEISEINSKINDLNLKMNSVKNENNFSEKLIIIQKELLNNNIVYNIVNESLFKSGSEVRVPTILCDYFYKAVSEKDISYLISLDKFWNNCLQKENYSNIEDLFIFIEDNNLTITPNGYLFLFRRVVDKNEENEDKLFEYVSNEWKKCIINKIDPTLYFVEFDGYDYYLSEKKSENSDSLESLMQGYFRDNINSPKYTDNHTKKFLYQLGKTYIINNVDNNVNNYCSHGLHLGSKDYVKNNGWLGSQIVGCIVNPRDIIAVADSASKLRVRKMHIACTISPEELDNFSATMFNYDYEELCNRDNEEYSTFTFNENFNSVIEYSKKLSEITEEISFFQKKLDEFATKTNLSKSKIISLLNNNYKTNN
ncbi:MAG TPA: hypothetical protein PKD00_00230 [Burkholderiales bacterium]|nr:hypothetical protein [Burkholderiales bacterium]